MVTSLGKENDGGGTQQGLCRTLNCVPRKYVQVLTPSACECDFIWKEHLCRLNQVKMGHTDWIRVGPNPVTGVFIRERRGKKAGDNGSRAGSDAATSQGTSRIAGSHQKPGKGKDFPQEPSDTLIADF